MARFFYSQWGLTPRPFPLGRFNVALLDTDRQRCYSLNMAAIKDLTDAYEKVSGIIQARLKEFKAVYAAGDDEALFAEMCFCVCAPQTNAHRAWDAAELLKKRGLLLKGGEMRVANALKECGVRFHNNKASYIVKNRSSFLPGIKERLDALLDDSENAARNVLARVVSGWGLKEASHFLRNTGHGGVCILDRHILRKLAEHKVIPVVPKTLSTALYFEIETKMIQFAQKLGIPVDALDLLFWHEAKNEVFK
jgi:N-glycosylase/DNA lyase